MSGNDFTEKPYTRHLLKQLDNKVVVSDIETGEVLYEFMVDDNELILNVVRVTLQVILEDGFDEKSMNDEVILRTSLNIIGIYLLDCVEENNDYRNTLKLDNLDDEVIESISVNIDQTQLKIDHHLSSIKTIQKELTDRGYDVNYPRRTSKNGSLLIYRK